MADAGPRSPPEGAAQESGPPEIPASEIMFNRKDVLGRGAFGSVFKGRCRGKEVAVKVPVAQDLDDDELETFRNEVVIMRKTFHPNIVLFLGACTEPGNIMLVSEILETDVENLLASEKGKAMKSPERVKLAKDAALGISWLHGIVNIIHRDLKPANLLVDKNGVVKVTDFGFSTLKSKEVAVRDREGEAKGTALYMAPEVMLQKDITFKIDVYAFGLVLWEIATGQELFAEFEDYDEFYEAIVELNERPPIEAIMPRSFGALMQRCWAADPDARPTMKEVVFRLDEVLVDTVLQVDEKRTEGRVFWKQNFLLPQQSLSEEINWVDFSRLLSKHLGCDEALCLCLSFVDYGEPIRDAAVPKKDDSWQHSGPKHMTLQRFANICVWFGPFFSTTDGIGLRVLNEIKVVVGHQWYHGNIDKNVAEKRLQGRPDGTFLVRVSSTTPGHPFTLTSIGSGGSNKIRHRRIKRIPGGGVTVAGRTGEIASRSLVGLIEKCFQAFSLTLPCERRPLETNSYATGYEDVDGDEA